MKQYKHLTNLLIIGVVILALFFGMRGGFFGELMGDRSGDQNKEEAIEVTDVSPDEREDIQNAIEAEKPLPDEVESTEEPSEIDTTLQRANDRVHHELYIRKRNGLLEYQLNDRIFSSLDEGMVGLDTTKRFIVRLSGNISAGEEKQVKSLLGSHGLNYILEN